VINTQEERLRFEKIMNTFAMVYGQATTKEKNRVYFNFLQEFPIEFLEAAAQRLLNKKKISTFPTIGEWKECCWQPEEFVREEAQLAWHSLEEHLVAVTIPTDHKILEAIRRIFGSWNRFKLADRLRDHWDRQDFIAAYLRVHREDEEAQLEAGMSEAQLERARNRLTGKKEGK